MKVLSVQYNGWGEQFTLGQLAEDRMNLIFEYSPEAIKRGIELSPLNLKLGSRSYSGFPTYQERLPGLIADSLPDGWGRLLMDRFFAQRGRMPYTVSALDRLAFIGDRAMGALSFVPQTEGTLPPEDLSLLAMAREVQAVIADKDTDALLELAMLGGSPQGARPKVLVNYDAATKRVSTEATAAGVPLLVKFPGANEKAEACLLEYCYAQMASDCGLVMPPTYHFPLGQDIAAFGIQRFDRDNGYRVPVLTMAGALDANFRIPNADYDTLLALTGFMTRNATQVLEAFRRCVFNVVFNNRDDHTKNFAFRMDREGQWALAPAYDLTFCTGINGEHQMMVQGEAICPGRSQLMALAHQRSIRPAQANAVIDQVVSVAERFSEYAGNLGIHASTVADIDPLIQGNITRCA